MHFGSPNLRRCLDDLESRIIPQVEEDLEQQWQRFSDRPWAEDVFTPARSRPSAPPAVQWPDTSMNRAQQDIETMLLQQFGGCSGAVARGGGQMLGVRCNYGVGILPSVFGAEIRHMAESQQQLPTSVPMGAARTRELLDSGLPDVRAGLGGRVFETAAAFTEVFGAYPKLKRWVHLYHPDLQGPMDVAELLWGSDLFTAVYTEPETVHAVLDLITRTYRAFMDEWDRVVPSANGHAVHWRVFHEGHVMLRDDSAMNFSPEHFDEFIRPYDQRLLRELHGGAVHFCGKGDHYIASLCTMSDLHAVNLSQPDLNDMEAIFGCTIDRGIRILDFSREHARRAVESGRPLHGLVQCF
jgi:hypothetical protein